MEQVAFKTMAERARALGGERIAAIVPGSRVSADEKPWAPNAEGPAFATGTCWTQCTFYAVDDFAAEVGFYLDILGLTAFVLGPSEAMFSNGSHEYYIGVRAATSDEPAADGRSLRVQFMVSDIRQVIDTLEQRGVVFEDRPEPTAEGSPMWFGSLRSPNGVRVDLWCFEG